jgi:chorismate mutase
MFISKTEKSNLYRLIEELEIQLRDDRLYYAEQISALKKSNSELLKRVNTLAAMGIADSAREKTIEKFIEQSTDPISDAEKALLRDAYRKEYSKQYYWRKKSEMLANQPAKGVRIKKSVEVAK